MKASWYKRYIKITMKGKTMINKNCLNDKNQHVGPLEEIWWVDMGWNCEASVKWCPECGAVVIDKTTDNRVMGRYVNMLFPKVTKDAVKSNKNR